MKYIDIHSHLNFPDYDADREDVIGRIQHEEIGVINVGIDVEGSRGAVSLAQRYNDMWATVAIHPTHTSESFDFKKIEELARDPNVVAIGECGLDYFRSQPEDIEHQRKVFVDHILLANSIKKPLMLHIRNGKDARNAYRDAVEILKQHSRVSVHFHFFAGSLEDLRMILDIGGTVSFTGVVTFARDYDELVRYVPAQCYMAETDAPFVAPHPYRGKRNESTYIREVVKAIALIRGESEEKVAEQCVDNARRVFCI